MLLRLSSSWVVIWLNESASSASSSSAMVVTRCDRVAARDFFRRLGERFDRRRNPARQVRWQPNSTQTSSISVISPSVDNPSDSHSTLPRHQLLVLALRSGNRVAQISAGPSQRHNYQSLILGNGNHHRVQVFAVRETVIRFFQQAGLCQQVRRALWSVAGNDPRLCAIVFPSASITSSAENCPLATARSSVSCFSASACGRGTTANSEVVSRRLRVWLSRASRWTSWPRSQLWPRDRRTTFPASG